MNISHRYIIILAGGTGERLWPLSRKDKPKQFLQVTNNQTLLEQTIERVRPLVADASHIWISTTKHHAVTINQLLKDQIGTLIIEPESRNTGPGILYSCYQLFNHDPAAEVIFIPADAFIPQTEYTQFRTYLSYAFEAIQTTDALVTCGVTPTYGATGYGYIEYLHNGIDQTSPIQRVVRFHEKPSEAVAQYYVESGSMLWNMGIVGGTVASFIHACATTAPDLFSRMQQVLNGNTEYTILPNISFDYAVLEHYRNVFTIPTTLSWCDVGNISVLLALKTSDTKSAPDISIRAHNNLVDAPNKLVALVGVDDLCIIDTPDVLLIIKKADAESVKLIVSHLKHNGLEQYL